MHEFARLRINGRTQPVAFVIRLDHRLVSRDVIRRHVTGWL